DGSAAQEPRLDQCIEEQTGRARAERTKTLAAGAGEEACARVGGRANLSRTPMPHLSRRFLYACVLMAAGVCAASSNAFAQTDEIQVYDGGLADKGKVNLTWHNNYTPDGLTTPAFPGALVSNHLYVGVTEWALGVTDWFEAGIYLPLYAADSHGLVFNGWKLRALFAVPHADDRKFFYGSNFEFSINQKRWDEKRYTSEVRPIIGWHLKPIDIIINPI